MTNAMIHVSIAAVVLIGVGASQFLSAFGKLRQGARTAKGMPGRLWTYLAAMIVCLCFIALGVLLLAVSRHPSLLSAKFFDFAVIPLGFAAVGIGLAWAKSGASSGIIQPWIDARSNMRDRTNAWIIGVLLFVVGIGFMLVGFVLLDLGLGSKLA